MTDYDLPITSYSPGDRVELHPTNDFWMAGDRYGDVAKVSRKMVHVKMDRSGLVRRFYPSAVGRVYS